MSVRSRSGPVAGIPWHVVAIAAVVIVLLLVLSPLYGWHRDELYFVVAGRHPAFGYVDQPALTPLLSAAAVALLGPTPTAVRILPALVMGALVVITSLMSRDLGGTPRATILAALIASISGLLAAGHLDATATYDLLAWALVLWLVIRLLAGGDPRLWVGVGLIAGIALENKHIILFLGAGLAGGLLLARRWDVIRSPWAWAALLIAVILWLPNLAWQAANGFPQLEMAAAISSDERAKIPIELALLAGPLLFPVSVAGGWWLFRSPAARPWRALAWTVVLVVLLDLVVGGKSYYAAGLLAPLMAAGSIPLDGWMSRGRTHLRTGMFAAAALVSGLIAAVLVLPIVPASSIADTPIPEIYKESAEQIGWPELVSAVERVGCRALPGRPEQGRDHDRQLRRGWGPRAAGPGPAACLFRTQRVLGLGPATRRPDSDDRRRAWCDQCRPGGRVPAHGDRRQRAGRQEPGAGWLDLRLRPRAAAMVRGLAVAPPSGLTVDRPEPSRSGHLPGARGHHRPP